MNLKFNPILILKLMSLLMLISFQTKANKQNFDKNLSFAPATVAGKIWEDSNKNGIEDNGELGIRGAYVLIYNSSGQQAGFMLSDANGKYQFSVPAGTYRIKIVLAGYNATTQNVGTNTAIDSDISIIDGYTASFTLADGEAKTGISAGFINVCGINVEAFTLCAAAPMYGNFDVFLKVTGACGNRYKIIVDQKGSLITFTGPYFQNDNIYQDKYYGGWYSSSSPITITVIDLDNPNLSRTIVVNPPVGSCADPNQVPQLPSPTPAPSGGKTSQKTIFTDVAVNMYPNPSNGNFVNLDLSELEGTKVDISILDISGALLQYIKVEDATYGALPIALNSLPNGIYIVRIDAEGTPTIGKLLSVNHP